MFISDNFCMSKRMLITSLLLLLIAFGIFMIFYGGYDDSPGGQLLGVILAVLGIIGVNKTRKKKLI